MKKLKKILLINWLYFSKEIIEVGDVNFLTGKNGAGKSTLFKIITKELSQDSGEVFIDKNKTLGYLSQNLALNSEKNIYEEALSVFDELLNIVFLYG